MNNGQRKQSSGDFAFVCNPDDPQVMWQCFDYETVYGNGPDCDFKCDNRKDEG